MPLSMWLFVGDFSAEPAAIAFTSGFRHFFRPTGNLLRTSAFEKLYETENALASLRPFGSSLRNSPGCRHQPLVREVIEKLS